MQSKGIEFVNPRIGLCCQFVEQPISFRTTTASSLMRMSPRDRRLKLSKLCQENAQSLLASLQYCNAQDIGCFRINSRILPAVTHPDAGYCIAELPQGDVIESAFRDCGIYAKEHNIRTVFHPDQYVVLNSPNEEVVTKSLAELEYHARVAEWVEADVINIHAGGVYGDRAAALTRLYRNLDRLTDSVRERLTIENDDRSYAPRDLLPICSAANVPLVYDVHHHRCLPDGLTIERATEAAIETWNREPLFHISSPLEGWKGPKPQRHHDYIDFRDFPNCWLQRRITVEVEAKAKELAVLRLRDELLNPPFVSSYHSCRIRVGG